MALHRGKIISGVVPEGNKDCEKAVIRTIRAGSSAAGGADGGAGGGGMHEPPWRCLGSGHDPVAQATPALDTRFAPTSPHHRAGVPLGGARGNNTPPGTALKPIRAAAASSCLRLGAGGGSTASAAASALGRNGHAGGAALRRGGFAGLDPLRGAGRLSASGNVTPLIACSSS